MGSLRIVPLSLREAREFIERHHRHNEPPKFWKFGCGLSDGERLVGVVVVGRPVSRVLDDGYTLEVTRCCTDGTKNACSMLYGAAKRAARALGYRRLITYTLEEEPGSSLLASGFREAARLAPRPEGWGCPSRERENKEIYGRAKRRWEMTL